MTREHQRQANKRGRARRIRRITDTVLPAIVFAAAADLMILAASIGQIAAEGRTGYWSGFWLAQVQLIEKIIH